MRKYIRILISGVLLYSFCTTLLANETSDFIKANELYKLGKYTEAIEIYENELKLGSSPYLYYNLGNAYYKKSEFGFAILNYERALKLDPTMSDAKFNLKVADTKIVDQIEVQPTFFLKSFIQNIIVKYSSNSWAVLSIISFSIVLAFIIAFIISITKRNRKIWFYASVIMFLVFVFSAYSSYFQKRLYLSKDRAVVLQGAVSAKSSPDDSGTTIFQLHEGTRVNVKSQLGEWSEIKLENGAVGWIKEDAIERI